MDDQSPHALQPRIFGTGAVMGMLAFVLLAVMVAFSGGGCDQVTSRIRPHWLRVFEKVGLQPDVLMRGDGRAVRKLSLKSGRTTRGDPFNGAEINGFVLAQHYGFWLDFTNTSDTPVLILWPSARYVDELGKPHEVYWQPRGALPDDLRQVKTRPPALLKPHERVRPTIVPIYKQYMVVEDCNSYLPYSEPLIPTRLDDKNERQMKTYVDDLARRQVPVKLVLPMEIAGIRYEYTFVFVLKPR